MTVNQRQVLLDSANVVIAGTVFMDIVFTGLTDIPSPGMESYSSGLGSSPGGMANVAVAVARLGLRSHLAADFADDLYGEYMRYVLSRQEGVDLSASSIRRGWVTPTTVSLVLDQDRSMVTYAVEPTLESPVESPLKPPTKPSTKAPVESLAATRPSMNRHIQGNSYEDSCVFTVPGRPHSLLGAGIADDENIADPRIAQVISEAQLCFAHIGTETNIPSIALAHRLGIPVISDVVWDHTQHWSSDVLDQLGMVDAFLPNAVEAMSYTRTTSPTDALVALGKHVPTAIVKCGKDGAIAIGENGDIIEERAIQVNALDTTGAGDVFDAAYIFGHLAGWSLEERVRFAVLCSGLSVRYHGGSLSAPTWWDISKWLETADTGRWEFLVSIAEERSAVDIPGPVDWQGGKPINGQSSSTISAAQVEGGVARATPTIRMQSMQLGRTYGNIDVQLSKPVLAKTGNTTWLHRQRAVRIAVIGGGSAYMPGIFRGVMHRGEDLSGSSMVLYDIDAERAELMTRLSNKMFRSRDVDMDVEASNSLEAAIADADMIFTTFRPGGFEARYLDESMPLKYGLLGQETVGVGGVFMACRSIPVMLRIAEIRDDVAPDAWIINYTNPTSLVTAAVERYSSGRVAGLCDQNVADTRTWMSLLGLHVSDGDQGVEVDWAGTNHATWALRVEIDGKDVDLSEKMDSIDLDRIAEDRFMYQLGWIGKVMRMPTNSYLRYYFFHDEIVKRLVNSATTRAQDIMAILPELYNNYRVESEKEYPDPSRTRGGGDHGEFAVDVMCAIAGADDRRFIINTLNHGAILDYQDDSVVEVPCLVNGTGIRPLVQGHLPVAVRGIAGAIEEHERLAVQAAVTGNRDVLLQALLSHPLMKSGDSVQKLLDEGIQANRAYLPQFFDDVDVSIAAVAITS